METNGTKYYVAGDTDNIPEIQEIECDIAFLPIGGTFTMDYKEAAELGNKIKTKIVCTYTLWRDSRRQRRWKTICRINNRKRSKNIYKTRVGFIGLCIFATRNAHLSYLYNNVIRFPILSTNPSSFSNFNSLIIALLLTFK